MDITNFPRIKEFNPRKVQTNPGQPNLVYFMNGVDEIVIINVG